MKIVKSIALSIALVTGSVATAGTIEPPIIEVPPLPPVDQGSSSNNLVVPLLLLTLIGLAAS
ncbi:MAG: hypothetical protein ACPGRD_06810 [Planktomarina sp.]